MTYVRFPLACELLLVDGFGLIIELKMEKLTKLKLELDPESKVQKPGLWFRIRSRGGALKVQE
jgi:hypothetical protein